MAGIWSSIGIPISTLDVGLNVYGAYNFTVDASGNVSSLGNITATGTLNIGTSVYGGTNFTVDASGNLTVQGVGDFTSEGIKILEEAISTPTSLGDKGELVYGTVGGFDYLFCAKDYNTWNRVNVTPYGSAQIKHTAAADLTITAHNIYMLGASTINRISAPVGNDIITIVFAANPVMTHGQASGSGFYGISLAHSANFNVAAGWSLTLRWDASSSQWVELARMKLTASEYQTLARGVEAKSGATTVSAGDSGKTIYNTAETNISLPTGATGLNYKFVVKHASYLRFTATHSEKIRYLDTQSAANGYFRSNTVGNVAEIEWVSDEWVATVWAKAATPWLVDA